MSFEDAEMKPDQEFSLKQDTEARIDYPLKATIFSNVTHLSLFFPTNFGSDRTRIYYIGLRGEYLSGARQKVSSCLELQQSEDFCPIRLFFKQYYCSNLISFL